uniref:Allantoicase domain-containing protein n=2 Tax=Ditylum brightwellii TaxID=49249 RepID=A0A7S2ELA5_9STRA|mmetsp:Transcript_33914/g.50609  ORF Transcript_33914/g.50609 Transcript_33914/m.50609 type:complete len:457 (+) Transcript_33914:50-1420(+)
MVSSHQNANEGTTPAKNESPPSPFTSHLSELTIGAHVLFATDDWFAAAENLLHSTPPTFIPDLYCTEGKVMDGWETRRRRLPGHDWCVIKLGGQGGIVQGIEIDTAHFTGNHVPGISIQGIDLSALKGTDSVSWMPGALERIVSSEEKRGIGASLDQVAAAQKACEGVVVGGDEDKKWRYLLEQTELKPGYEETRMHRFYLEYEDKVTTHVRVNYHPDGGVARLKVWGIPSPSSPKPPLYSPAQTSHECTVVPHSCSALHFFPALPTGCMELSSSTMGGRGVHCSDRHYGIPSNLIQHMAGRDMGDGWETARHPDRPSIWVKNEETGLLDSNLMDYCILKLGSVSKEGGICRIVLDTRHFRGNYPESAKVEGCYIINDAHIPDHEIEEQYKESWFTLIPRSRLGPDSLHVYDADLDQIESCEGRKVSHVKVTIYPDGGLSRVRVYGFGDDVCYSRL